MEEIASKIDSYLSFKLMDEIFAVNVVRVLEILENKTVTKVPKTPDYMLGITNLRGNGLPVIDTRIKFGMPGIEETVDTCIIVVEVNIGDELIIIGAMVDGVSEVLTINSDDIESTPNIGENYKSEFIDGMFKKDDGFIMLLNLDNVFSTSDAIVSEENLFIDY